MAVTHMHLALEVRLDEGLVRKLRRAADVEGAHGELRARLADRLRRDDAHGLAHVDGRAAREVAAIALGADAVLGLAGEHRTDLHFLNAGGVDRLDVPFLNHLAGGHDHLAVRGLQILGGGAAENARRQRRDDLAGVDDRPHADAVLRTAIRGGDDRILRHVDETAGEITRVRGLQRRIREALAGAVGGVEVFENRQAFLEVRDDRALDDLAGGLGHQAAHGGELLHLLRRTARARMRHHVDRVDRHVAAVLVLLHRRDADHHLLGELVRALHPGVDDLVVFLALGDEAVVVLLLIFLGGGARLRDDTLLRLRHDHVVLAEGDAGLEGLAEAQRHDAVAENDRLLLTAVAVDGVDHVRDFLLGHQLVDDVEGNLHMLRHELAEDQTAGRRVEDLRHALALLVIGPGAALDLRVQRDRLRRDRVLDLALIGEAHALARLAVALQRQIIEAENDILRRHDDRLTIGRMQDVVRRHHQHARFELRFERQRHVHGHLVAVEVGVEGRADERMQLDRLALDQHRLEGLNAETMQRRRAVQQNRMLANDLVEDIPNLGLLLLDELLRLLDGRGIALRVEARIDEGLEQLQRHLLRQAALMQLQFRDRRRSPNGPNSRRACRAGSGGSGPACPSACRRATSADACWRP